MAYPFPFVAGNILTATELNALEDLAFAPLGYESTFYYTVATSTSAGNTLSNQVTHFLPFYVGKTTTWDRIACRTSSTFSGTATIRLGLYNNDSATGKPSTVKLDAGTVSCTAANTTYAITINQSLTTGWYWLAICTQGAATTNSFLGPTTYEAFLNTKVPANFANPVTTNGYQMLSVSGAFPTASSLIMSGNYAFVYLRAA